MLRIVCVSDTHGRHRRTVIPDGDILIHAGDLTLGGGAHELPGFDAWLASLPHRHKVIICGNHDWCFQNEPEQSRAAIRSGVYLQDESVELEGVRFHGSPWQPWFLDWAFNLPRGPELAAKWALIPEGTNVLITHGPPAGILDLTKRGDRPGCADLLERVRVVRPAIHVCGHIHEAAGTLEVDGTLFVNASCYSAKSRPLVVDYDADRATVVAE